MLGVDRDLLALFLEILDDRVHLFGGDTDVAVRALLADRVVADPQQRPLDRDALLVTPDVDALRRQRNPIHV